MTTISDAQALQILRQSTDKTNDAQSKATTAALGSQVNAKLASAKALQASHQGDQFSAVSKAAMQGLGMMLNSKLNMQATRGVTAKDRATMSVEEISQKQARQSGMNAATSGGGVSNVVTQGADAVDQTIGFAKASSDAKIVGKEADVRDTMAGQVADLAKANKDRAIKGIDSVDDFGKGLVQRAKEVIDRMFS